MFNPVQLTKPFQMVFKKHHWDVDVVRQLATHRPTKTAYQLTGDMLDDLTATLICGDADCLTVELHEQLGREAILQYEWAAHDAGRVDALLERLARFGRYGQFNNRQDGK